MIHTIFDIFAFTVALLELIHLYLTGKVAGRRWIIPTLIGLLVALCGIVAFEYAAHEARLQLAERSVREMLEEGDKTFDEIARSVDYDDLPFVSEVLKEMNHSGILTHDDIALSRPDGSAIHQVRVYGLRNEPILR